MEWIKKNPAQLILALVAIGVLATSFLLYNKIDEFKTALTGWSTTPNKDNKIPALNTEMLTTAEKALSAPAQWAKSGGSLFVSQKYVLKEGIIVKPNSWTFNPPVPNTWLEKYGIDYLDPSVLDADPDKDGFTTRLEFNGLDGMAHLDMAGQPVLGADGKPLPDDSTNPMSADSHPPYYTRLTLKEVKLIPFRLRFMSYDANKAGKVDTVQINTLDRGNRSMFVPLGDDIPGTRFKTVSFQKKEVPDKDGTKKDVSELTILNNESKETLVLVLDVVRDSPDSYIVLQYDWVGADGQSTPNINKHKGETFSLSPETNKAYKVIDIKAPDPQKSQRGEAKIQTPSGNVITLHSSN